MDQASPPPRITVEAFNRLLDESAPFQKIYGFVTEEIGFGTASVRLPAGDAHVRPGGTLSGPAQMALADFAMYAALLGALGEVPLAVTTSLNINFLQRPRPGAANVAELLRLAFIAEQARGAARSEEHTSELQSL